MKYLAILLLVGTIYAEQPDYLNEVNNGPSEDGVVMPPARQDMSAALDMETCEDVATIELKEGAEEFCPGKSTCTLKAYNCSTTFSGAESACKRFGGRLVAIHNTNTNKQVRRLAVNAIGNNWLWIGVSRNSAGYRNSDGSNFDYSNFAYGMRRTWGNWCVMMHTTNVRWYSWYCDCAVPYICAF